FRVADEAVGVSGCLGRPTVANRVVFQRMSELNIVNVASAHSIKLPVGREEDAAKTSSPAGEIRASCPATARGRWRWRRSRPAANEIELADARCPIESARCRFVFVHMPERHPIARIDRRHAVIAPAIYPGFTSVTGKHNGLALCQVVRWIAHKASRVTHSGMQAGTGRGIANGHVARRVHSYAGHKSPHAIVIITPVLLLRGRSGEIAAGNIELIPANSCRPARKIEHNCLDGPQGFRAAKILVNDRGHDFVAKSVDELGDTLLRND